MFHFFALILPLFFILALLWLGVPALIARDAQRRGERGSVWWLLTFFSFLGGVVAVVVVILAWLVIRRRLPIIETQVTSLRRVVLLPAAALSLIVFGLVAFSLANHPSGVTPFVQPASTAPPTPPK